MEGFAQISRKVLEWEYFKDSNCIKVLVYLLVHAKYAPEIYDGILYQVDDVRFTYNELATACGISVSAARNAICKLKATGILTVRTTSKYSVGSLQDWAKRYEGEEKTTGKTTSKSTPSYNKEYKQEEKYDFGKRKDPINYHL